MEKVVCITLESNVTDEDKMLIVEKVAEFLVDVPAVVEVGAVLQSGYSWHCKVVRKSKDNKTLER